VAPEAEVLALALGGELTTPTAISEVMLINSVKNIRLAFRMDCTKVTMMLDPFFFLNLRKGVVQYWPIQNKFKMIVAILAEWLGTLFFG